MRIFSEEHKKKLSISASKRKHTAETKTKLSIFMKGKTSVFKGKYHSEESKLKISLSGRGRKSWNKGIPCSEETKHKISIANQGRVSNRKGVKLSPETCKKMSESNKGKYVSPPPIFYGKDHWNWKGGITDKTHRFYNLKRYFLIKNAGILTKSMIQNIYEDNIKKYGTLTCYLCSEPIKFSEDSLEHKIPLSRGGTNQLNNLDIAHKRCNRKKYNKTYEEYISSKNGGDISISNQ